MNMERKVISNNAIIVLDRDVNASELNALPRDFKGDIVINGDLILDESLLMKGNLHIIADVVCVAGKCDLNINIEGDLYCYGYIDAYQIDISGFFFGENDINSTNIKVAEDFYCNAKIDTNYCDITVAGELACHSIDVAAITLWGRINVTTSIEAANISVLGY